MVSQCLMIFNGGYYAPDSKVHGANMGPIWGRQDPGGPHVGPVNLAIWGRIYSKAPQLLLHEEIYGWFVRNQMTSLVNVYHTTKWAMLFAS